MFSTSLRNCSQLEEKNPNQPSLYNEENTEFVALGFQGLLAPVLVEIQSVLKGWIVGL